MTEGISKENLININPWDYDNQQDLLNAILWLCKELNEYTDLPQTVCTQEGTVINVTDGDFRGKWVSTKEGWVPHKQLQEYMK